MKAESTSYISGKSPWEANSYRGLGNALYGLGFIGALIYYFQMAETFWMFVLGFLKALVWPAFIVYDVFKHLAG